MAIKPWAGEGWIGAILLIGGVAIVGISFTVDHRSTTRTAIIGAAILSGGIGTIIHARSASKAQRCTMCTNLLTGESQWTLCKDCNVPIHDKCMEMHAEVYHPAPGAGPYRSGD